jgi:hypothetical protein
LQAVHTHAGAARFGRFAWSGGGAGVPSAGARVQCGVWGLATQWWAPGARHEAVVPRALGAGWAARCAPRPLPARRSALASVCLMAGRLVCRRAAAPPADGWRRFMRGSRRWRSTGGAVLWWSALSGRIGQGQPLRALRGIEVVVRHQHQHPFAAGQRRPTSCLRGCPRWRGPALQVEQQGLCSGVWLPGCRACTPSVSLPLRRSARYRRAPKPAPAL